MSILATSHEAIQLLFSGDTALWSIVGVSFSVSLFAMAVVLLPALLLAFALAYGSFPGRWLLISIINTLQSVPTVVIGLLLYMMLSRSGPLGDWQLLFTQEAMVIGQIFICFPIMVAMMHGAFQHSDRRVWETAFTLGASLPRAFGSLIWETRFPILAAVIAGFSRIITEVGCSMMVGGNIFNATRNIPTAIAMESQKGAFVQGIALGMVLLILALVLNFLLSITRGKGYLRT